MAVWPWHRLVMETSQLRRKVSMKVGLCHASEIELDDSGARSLALCAVALAGSITEA
jgi:aerobic-type carbon monoxide dehydrogenase small subunit (CoxS/CutS family)